MQHKWSQLLKTPVARSVMLLAIILIGSGLYFQFHHLLMPGDVSAAQINHQPLAGYASHATFEQECDHCHAPLHCVTAERCQDCHVEIAEQRAEAMGLHGQLPGTDRCQTCHVEHQGREATISTVAFANIDHEAMTGFSLAKHTTNFDGSPLNCESCHTQGRFGPDTVACQACHNDQNAALMSDHGELFGTDCMACHDGRDKMSDFDHNQVYPLEAAHEAIECTECHSNHQFLETARTCANCHESEAKHADTFGTDCARCHSAAAWTPAQLTHHTFSLEHGGEGKLECQTCHTNNYYEHTCYDCHEKEQMATDHAEENQPDIDNCIDCHPTGAANEAEQLGDYLAKADG